MKSAESNQPLPRWGCSGDGESGGTCNARGQITLAFCPVAFSSSAQLLRLVKTLMVLEGWDLPQLLKVAKEALGRRMLDLRVLQLSAVERWDVSSVADASHIPLGLRS